MKNLIKLTLFVLLSLGLITSGANAGSSRHYPGKHTKKHDSWPPKSQGIKHHRKHHHSIDARLESLQQQIDNIESTPGPEGPQGEPGPPGPSGEFANERAASSHPCLRTSPITASPYRSGA